MSTIDANAFVATLTRSLYRPRRQVLTHDGFRRAGVLVPLVLLPSGVELLFTKRTEEVETHKGQVSFPGGMADDRDTDIVQTSLREMEEELGVSPSVVEVAGLLDDLATPTGFVITPVVGVLRGMPRIEANALEVAEAFFVPLEFFRNSSHGRTEMREFRGERKEIWFYDTGRHNIWGATAMIIRSLLTRLGAP